MTYLDRQRDRRRSENTLFLFDTAVTAAHRDAVNLTFWAAERHADRSFGRLESDPSAWSQTCRKVLGNCGWVTVESAYSTTDDVADPEFSAASIVIDALGDTASAAKLIASLESIADWPMQPLWAGTVHEAEGDLVLSTVILTVAPAPVEPEVLEIPLDDESEEHEPIPPEPRFRIETITWSAKLNDTIYTRIRDALLSKLEKAEPELERAHEREQDIRDRLAFIASLEMPPDETALETVQGAGRTGILETVDEDESDSAYVAKHQVVSFVSNVHGPAKRDVLDCTLLAQEGADRKFSRVDGFVSWQRFYLNVLRQTGWDIQLLESVRPTPGQTVADASLSMLQSGVTAPELAVAQAALDATDRIDPDELEDGTATYSTASFQIASCAQTRRRVTMTVVVLHVEMSGSMDRVLRHEYDASESWLAETHRCVLDLDDYAHMRASVRRKLRNKVEEFVHALEFVDPI